MFNRLSLAFVLSASFSCFAQVTTVGGTATTAGPAVPSVPMSAANAPLISTPEIALPGSGSAVGAPLSSAAANDSRASSGPSVYNPNGAAYAVPALTTATVATVPTGAGAPAGTAETPATEPFENGIQHFQSGLPIASNPTQSLAQIARAYRGQHAQPGKTFNNDSIAQLNARGVRTGNLGPETSTVVANNQAEQTGPGGTLMAQNQPPALPQGDQNLAAASAPPPSPTAWQQRHRAAEQSSAATNGTGQDQASAAQQTAPPTEQNNTKQTAALPQTGSPLPLLLLLGGLGVVGGVAYWLRR